MFCATVRKLSFENAKADLHFYGSRNKARFAYMYVASVCIVMFVIVAMQFCRGAGSIKNTIVTINDDEEISMYAVFGASTPSGESHRAHDYAYHLPLTALAWERIGFKSIVLIIGSRCEWENDPALKHILVHLESKKTTTVIFVESSFEHRAMLGQTARLFIANFPEFPGKSHDYIITSDADLWPLHKEHYLPRAEKNLVLVHSLCCGFFEWKGKTYREYPMGNIGAPAYTWREIANEGRQVLAKDANSILEYFQDEFGNSAFDPVVFAKDNWFFDQRLISIRIAQWIDRYGNDTIFAVSDEGWTRLDRMKWNADGLNKSDFEKRYDAHMPILSFLPGQWKNILPLVYYMYGSNSSKTKYCDDYTKTFQNKVKNYYAIDQMSGA